jgi:hypothetical protein
MYGGCRFIHENYLAARAEGSPRRRTAHLHRLFGILAEYRHGQPIYIGFWGSWLNIDTDMPIYIGFSGSGQLDTYVNIHRNIPKMYQNIPKMYQISTRTCPST